MKELRWGGLIVDPSPLLEKRFWPGNRAIGFFPAGVGARKSLAGRPPSRPPPRGIGEGLLLGALERASGLSDKLGVCGVEVVAIDAAAVAFYRKYGFTPLLDSPRHLFLPIETVRKVLA